jgi:hypothetical protein
MPSADALPSYKEVVLLQESSNFYILAFWRSTVSWFGYQHSIFLLDYAAGVARSLFAPVSQLLFG